MSQDTRRRLAARRRLQPQPHTEAEVPAALRIRRFSEGLERPVLDVLHPPHVGRFSQGAERLPEDAPGKSRIGGYGDGLDPERESTRSQLHVGRFSQGIDHSEW